MLCGLTWHAYNAICGEQQLEQAVVCALSSGGLWYVYKV